MNNRWDAQVGRTIKGLKEQVQLGFYGDDERGHTPVDDHCSKYVGHAQYWLKTWLYKNGYSEEKPKKHQGDDLLIFGGRMR